MLQECLDAVEKQFGATSERVMIMKGQLHECTRDYASAEKIYKSILTISPSNMVRLLLPRFRVGMLTFSVSFPAEC